MFVLGYIIGTLLTTLAICTVYGLLGIAILNLVVDIEYTFNNVVFSILATVWFLALTGTKINGDSK
jgi:hypothetical protein